MVNINFLRIEMESSVKECESHVLKNLKYFKSLLVLESHNLWLLCKIGGKFLQNLNMKQRPIEEKYCEGKLKRTMKIELKVPEIVQSETNCGKGFI